MEATERRSFEKVLKELPSTRASTAIILDRIKRISHLEAGARILDIGAAQGDFIAACTELGYRCEGVEPCASARDIAQQLATHLGISLRVVAGTAESIPFPDCTFDLVHAASVIEHVADAQKAFVEALRVLKPGGVLYFRTANSLCPSQSEIRGFPLFGWYPDPIKQQIMAWAKTSRPELIGHTDTPAIHWFTPWKARRMLGNAGFRAVYDRWDLRGEDEGGEAHRLALKVIRSGRLAKIAADVAFSECTYAAIK